MNALISVPVVLIKLLGTGKKFIVWREFVSIRYTYKILHCCYMYRFCALVTDFCTLVTNFRNPVCD